MTKIGLDSIGKGNSCKGEISFLERFIHYEEDVMCFMDNDIVPFTDNQDAGRYFK